MLLQGEVEQISLMKPKAPTPHETGMLEYLEEIIGTYTYVPLIEEAATEVDSLNELRSEKVYPRVATALPSCCCFTLAARFIFCYIPRPTTYVSCIVCDCCQ